MIQTRRIVYLLVITVLLIAGCNLQQAMPTPTLAVTPASPTTNATSIQESSTSQPGIQMTTRATLPPPPLASTPTALPIGEIPPNAPTLAVLGPDVPTLSAASAAYRYEVKAAPGKRLRLHYNIQLKTGAVSLVMQGPEGVIWQKSFTATAVSQDELTLAAGGVYEILVFAERFDGSYSVWWE